MMIFNLKIISDLESSGKNIGVKGLLYNCLANPVAHPINYLARLLLITAITFGFGPFGCGHLSLENNSDPGPIIAAIDFYRGPLNHLNAIRAGACPMHPSCSDYSRQAIKKHGLIIGWIMACDRLMRCGRDELDKSPRLLIGGKRKCLDPLAGNDWWWDKPAPIVRPLRPIRDWQISID